MFAVFRFNNKTHDKPKTHSFFYELLLNSAFCPRKYSEIDPQWIFTIIAPEMQDSFGDNNAKNVAEKIFYLYKNRHRFRHIISKR
jgi:hypothetical protein